MESRSNDSIQGTNRLDACRCLCAMPAIAVLLLRLLKAPAREPGRRAASHSRMSFPQAIQIVWNWRTAAAQRPACNSHIVEACHICLPSLLLERSTHPLMTTSHHGMHFVTDDTHGPCLPDCRGCKGPVQHMLLLTSMADRLCVLKSCHSLAAPACRDCKGCL